MKVGDDNSMPNVLLDNWDSKELYLSSVGKRLPVCIQNVLIQCRKND